MLRNIFCQGNGFHVADEEKNQSDSPVIIKKYANRRLYNTQTSSYVHCLAHNTEFAAMCRTT